MSKRQSLPLHSLRYTTLALALAASFSAWGQGTVNGFRDDMNNAPNTLDGSNDKTYKNGLILPGLDTGNSNLPPTGPKVFVDKIGDADYRLNALVGKISVGVDSDSIPADGITPVHLSIQVFDYKGQPVRNAVVTVESSGGRLQIPGAATDEFGPGRKDADKITQGIQVKVVDGKAEVLLLAPFEPQDVTVRVTAGKAQAKGVISFIPELREMLAVGLVEGIIHFDKKSPLSLSTANTGDGFEQEIQSFSRSGNDGKTYGAMRTAFFLKGKIKGDALLTMAFDSDKNIYGRLFRDINPDDYYAVYGDSSIKGFDAQSKSKLYVRIDKEKS